MRQGGFICFVFYFKGENVDGKLRKSSSIQKLQLLSQKRKGAAIVWISSGLLYWEYKAKD